MFLLRYEFDKQCKLLLWLCRESQLFVTVPAVIRLQEVLREMESSIVYPKATESLITMCAEDK